MLSLLSASESDAIDWSRGAYETTLRGRWEGAPQSVVSEGSVLAASAAPRGRTWTSEPGIVRSGLGLGVPVLLGKATA